MCKFFMPAGGAFVMASQKVFSLFIIILTLDSWTITATDLNLQNVTSNSTLPCNGRLFSASWVHF